MTIRIGFGYDIHRLVEGRALHLGGVEIPFGRGLAGHSDGDAAAHAVADAMLGAAGLGDLGDHFPSASAEWKDVSGVRLLEVAAGKVRARGFRPAQIEITLLAEAPRLAPYRESMERALARAAGCETETVSVKARSHDGLGEIGRGEAMAAYAVLLLVPISADAAG